MTKKTNFVANLAESRQAEHRMPVRFTTSAGIAAIASVALLVCIGIDGEHDEIKPDSIWLDLDYLSEPEIESEFLLLALPEENAESEFLIAHSGKEEVIAMVKNLEVRPYRLRYRGWHAPGPKWLFREFGHTKSPRVIYCKGGETTEIYGYVEGTAFLSGHE